MVSKKRGSSGENDRTVEPEGGDAMAGPPRQKPAAKSFSARSGGTRPRLKASHANLPVSAESPLARRPSPKTKRPVVDLSSDAIDAFLADESGAKEGAKKTTRKAKPVGKTRKAELDAAQAEELQAPIAASTERKSKASTGEKKGAKRAAPSVREPSSQARELAVALAMEGIEKKAIGIEILDVSGKIDYADFLVIMTGRSDRHVQAIASGLEEAMKKKKFAPLSVEGREQANWVLMDYGDVVVHVFQEDTRKLYDIEGLWIDAGRLSVPPGGDRPAKSPAQSPV